MIQTAENITAGATSSGPIALGIRNLTDRFRLKHPKAVEPDLRPDPVEVAHIISDLEINFPRELPAGLSGLVSAADLIHQTTRAVHNHLSEQIWDPLVADPIGVNKIMERGLPFKIRLVGKPLNPLATKPDDSLEAFSYFLARTRDLNQEITLDYVRTHWSDLIGPDGSFNVRNTIPGVYLNEVAYLIPAVEKLNRVRDLYPQWKEGGKIYNTDLLIAQLLENNPVLQTHLACDIDGNLIRNLSLPLVPSDNGLFLDAIKQYRNKFPEEYTDSIITTIGYENEEGGISRVFGGVGKITRDNGKEFLQIEALEKFHEGTASSGDKIPGEDPSIDPVIQNLIPKDIRATYGRNFEPDSDPDVVPNEFRSSYPVPIERIRSVSISMLTQEFTLAQVLKSI